MKNVVYKDGFIYLNVNGIWFRYNESHTLGGGAMGNVYLGADCNTGEKVAIKKLHDKYSNNKTMRQRAKMESSLMFRHHNLVEMIGYCEESSDYGPVFIVSKLVRGVNIDKYINGSLRNLPNATIKICQMFLPVLDALDYIHSKNILHLDVKPSNILVENGSNVRLMDLGIAQRYSYDDAGNSGTMGTPKYAAPEQIAGCAETQSPLTPQTDIYEAGVTLYELLTGYNPYSGSSMDEIRRKHQKMLLPSHVNISAPILKVLLKATAFKPENRYGKVREFKQALQVAMYKPEKKHDYISIANISAIILIVLALIAAVAVLVLKSM